MFAGTENREFHCAKCKRKEEKRKYYWGEALGIPAVEWPLREQNDYEIRNQDDILPNPESEVPPPALGKARRALGLFAEDMEAEVDLQENVPSKSKRRKRKKKRTLGNPSSGGKTLGPSESRKKSLAQDLGGLQDEESHSSTFGSDDWYDWEEDNVRKNVPWWKTEYRCQRCSDHHEAHKKWKPKIPKSPYTAKLFMHARMVMRRLLARKDSLTDPSLDILLNKWWEGKKSCKKCKKHHDPSGDKSSTCSSSPIKKDIDIDNASAIAKPEGALGIDTLSTSLPVLNPGNPEGLAENLDVGILKSVENPSATGVKDTTNASHFLSPSERFVNKWKERNLSLRWWEPETNCKKCTYHHRELKRQHGVGDTADDAALEPLPEPPTKGIYDLTNWEHIYLPPGPELLDSTLPILENDAKIKARLKPINTTRKLKAKPTLPCSLHSKTILEESKQKGARASIISRESINQGKESLQWWDVGKNCERFFQHHMAHPKPKTRTPKEILIGGRSGLGERRKVCEKCLHHHEAAEKLNSTGVSGGLVTWKSEQNSKRCGRKDSCMMSSQAKPKVVRPSTMNPIFKVPCDLKVVRGVEQNSVTSSTATTSSFGKNENFESKPPELKSEVVTSRTNGLETNEGIARSVDPTTRVDMHTVDERGSNPHSQSGPNLVHEIGVQTLPVQIIDKPRHVEQKVRNPWPELQAPTPQGELQKLRAKEHEENQMKSLVNNELKRRERITRLSTEAQEQKIREALKRAPRITPVGYKWRESFKTGDKSASESKQLHTKEFNVLGKARDRPITSLFVKDSTSQKETPNRAYLRRKRELISQRMPKGPSHQPLERQKPESGNRFEPKIDSRVQSDSPLNLSEILKASEDDWNKDHDATLPKVKEDQASTPLNGDGPIPKLEGILPRENELENQSEIIDVATLPAVQNESKLVGSLQPVPNDLKDLETSLHVPKDSKDARDPDPIVRDDELKILEDHAHLPKGELCFMPITQCMKCLQNHQKCTKRSNNHVHIPRLDLQKVRDAQKREGDGHVETPAASYVGCFGPTKRNVKRKRWTDPQREISSSSLTSTIESGTSTGEDNASGPGDSSKHSRKAKGSRDLLEQARMKLSFCHL